MKNKLTTALGFLGLTIFSIILLAQQTANSGGGGGTSFVQSPDSSGSITNVATTVPWLTYSGQGTKTMTLATNSTKIIISANTDLNANSLTNFPSALTNGFVTASVTNGLVTSAITNGLATASYVDTQDGARVATNNATFLLGLTNVVNNVPWETITGQGTRVMTIATNATKILINANTDNNGAGLTNAPAGAIISGTTNFVLTASGAGLPATFAAAASSGAATNAVNNWTATQNFNASATASNFTANGSVLFVAGYAFTNSSPSVFTNVTLSSGFITATNNLSTGTNLFGNMNVWMGNDGQRRFFTFYTTNNEVAAFLSEPNTGQRGVRMADVTGGVYVQADNANGVIINGGGTLQGGNFTVQAGRTFNSVTGGSVQTNTTINAAFTGGILSTNATRTNYFGNLIIYNVGTTMVISNTAGTGGATVYN